MMDSVWVMRGLGSVDVKDELVLGKKAEIQ